MKTWLRALKTMSAGAFVFACAKAGADVLPTGWATARALGMGNAYTSVVSDADAAFYNPAAATRIHGLQWTILEAHGGIDNPQNVSTIKSLSNTSDFANQINQLYGNQIWANGGGKTAIALPGVILAGFVNAQGGALALNPPDPRANIDYYFDYGASATFAYDFVPSVFSLGVTARYINRTGYQGSVGAATLAQSDTTALQNDLKSRGTGIGVDAGAELRLPGPISPSLSLVYRDIGTTSFSHTEGAQAPPSSPSELIAGASITLKALLIDITPSVDYRYIGWSNVPTGENVNAGLEISLPLIDLRGGISQGYYTAGVGFDFLIGRADVATWAVEMGAYPGQQVDRRYMAQLTFELDFDPGKYLGFGSSSRSSSDGSSGSSSDSSSDTTTHRRRLKQRR